MLVNEKFFKKIFSISIVLLISTNLAANEKDRIISGLNSLNSLEFTFNQLINEKEEKGTCLSSFPDSMTRPSVVTFNNTPLTDLGLVDL